MKHLDPFVVDVDERQVVQLLQHEVAGIIENIRAPMLTRRLEKALESEPVMQILAGMNLIAAIHANFVEHIEYRLPPPRQLGKPSINQTRRTLRPWIDEGPQQSAGKRHLRGMA